MSFAVLLLKYYRSSYDFIFKKVIAQFAGAELFNKQSRLIRQTYQPRLNC